MKRPKPKEIKVGDKIEHLIVYKEVENNRNKVRQFLCHCLNHPEPKEVIFNIQRLRLPRTISCGCIVLPRTDYTGQKIGELTVIRSLGTVTDKHKVEWECECSCGNVCVKSSVHLGSSEYRSGKKALSCGHLSEPEDIVGQKFGTFTVEERVGYNSSDKATWKCLCDCGNYSTKILPHLRRAIGNKFCKCKNTQDLSKQKFNNLIAIKPDTEDLKYWNCTCLCGNTDIVVLGSFLTSGRVKSCGCLYGNSTKEHGYRNHPIYHLWESMKSRCNPNTGHLGYAGKGIKVCAEWINNSKTFIEWCLANGWREGYQLDRFPDRDGDYSPSNCRFVTSKENNRNKDSVKRVGYKGRMLCIGELIEETGCKLRYDTISNRVFKYGWSVEDAISIEPSTRRGPRGPYKKKFSL